MPAKKSREQPTGYTVRPPEEWADRFTRIVQELGWSGGQLCAEAARAVVEMIEGDTLEVPEVVQMARVVRQHKASMKDAKRPFPNHEPRDKREVSTEYPAHRIPRFSRISCGTGSDSGESLRDPDDQVQIPAGLFEKAHFAVIVEGDSMEPVIRGGETAVFVRAERAHSGQLVAVLLPEGGVCLKKYVNGPNPTLRSENPKYAPIPAKDIKIQGVYVGKL